MAYLGDKAVGSIVKIKENGTAVNYIIVHKGKPSSLYDSSCDGVWVLRETTLAARAWDGTSSSYDNDYENSGIKKWLDGDFLNTIDSKIRAAIKTVKIPFKKGTGSGGSAVQSGANGLSCKAFLLSGYEVGFTTSDNQYFPVDGAKLAYFLNGNSDAAAKEKRIAKDANNAAAWWWLRSPYASGASFAWSVNADGTVSGRNACGSGGVRPAFVLPSNLLVTEDGSVSTNTLPTITSNKTGNLGTLTSGYTCTYSVNDADSSDSVTVKEYLDGTQKKSYTATKNKSYTYALTGNEWLKITNGSHTYKITASDGKDTVESVATFTRSLNALSVELAAPLEADDKISACALNVEGNIPTDAVCKFEVTNNAKDVSPVWEDCTAKCRAGFSYVFKNKTAANGFAFSFRISIKRGSTNAGGYITKISGGFE